MHLARSALPLLLCCTAVSAVAQDSVQQPAAAPAVFRQLVECRAIQDSTQRLECYDARVAALAQAEEREEVVIADPRIIREAQERRVARVAAPEFQPVESTIAATGQSGGDLVFVLADGGRWRQTDGRPAYPRVGEPVRIREAALGSYFATIGEGRAIRVTPLRD